jgi:hypothetical protein
MLVWFQTCARNLRPEQEMHRTKEIEYDAKHHQMSVYVELVPLLAVFEN